jgi:hypothetical protein
MPPHRQCFNVSCNTMNSFQKYLSLSIFALISVHCNNSKRQTYNRNESDSLLLKIQIKPAFEEHSEIVLFKTDSIQYIKILLENYAAVDIPKDTFWFRKINLNEKEFQTLDSSLIRMCKQKDGFNTPRFKSVDGMTISSTLIDSRDTNHISLRCASLKADRAAYFFSRNILRILQLTFQDSLLTDYFNEMEEYIDPSKDHKADPKRKIDQLRIKKYHWTIGNQDSN